MSKHASSSLLTTPKGKYIDSTRNRHVSMTDVSPKGIAPRAFLAPPTRTRARAVSLPQSPSKLPVSRLRQPQQRHSRPSLPHTGAGQVPHPVSPSSIPPRLPPLTAIVLKDIKTFHKPHPSAVVAFLGLHGILGAFDVDDLVALHERELMEKQSMPSRQPPSDLDIFNTPLRQIALYASAKAQFGDFYHDLPIVVFACIERLYRDGLERAVHIYETDNPIPSPTVMIMKDLFGALYSFGVDETLDAYSSEDILLLLVTFMKQLQEPILGPMTCFSSAISTYCINTHHRDDESGILIVQCILRLLPSANLSLFVYLMAFLKAQMPRLDECSAATKNLRWSFSSWLFGSQYGIELLHWFLSQWNKIVRGLFTKSFPGMSGAFKPAPPSIEVVSPKPTKNWAPSFHDSAELLGSSSNRGDQSFEETIRASQTERCLDERILDIDMPSPPSLTPTSSNSTTNSGVDITHRAQAETTFNSLAATGFRLLDKLASNNKDIVTDLVGPRPTALCDNELCKSKEYIDILEQKLVDVIKERDEARNVVDDIRSLMHA